MIVTMIDRSILSMHLVTVEYTSYIYDLVREF
jgi:hypothetical protein